MIFPPAKVAALCRRLLTQPSRLAEAEIDKAPGGFSAQYSAGKNLG
jgi:hypothetical protein